MMVCRSFRSFTRSTVGSCFWSFAILFLPFPLLSHEQASEVNYLLLRLNGWCLILLLVISHSGRQNYRKYVNKRYQLVFPHWAYNAVMTFEQWQKKFEQFLRVGPEGEPAGKAFDAWCEEVR